MSKAEPIEIVHTEVPPAVTAARVSQQPIASNGRAQKDPMWNTRRRRLDASLTASLAISLYSMYLGPPIAAIVVPPAFVFAGMVIGAYMGFVEWGRINGVVSPPVSSFPKGDERAGN